MVRTARYGLPVLVLAAVVSLFLAVVCDGGGAPSSEKKIKVVTTLPLFADFVREIGGERVEVTSLIPPGIDPQTWEPAPGNAERVAEAQIAFANSPEVDSSAIALIQAHLRPEAHLVQFAGDEEAEEHLEHEAGAEIFKETGTYLWMSLQNGKAYAQFVRIHLTALDPAGDEEYSRNARSYFERVDETERYAFKVLDSIPPENKKLITPDNSFEYFGSYYAVELTAQLSLYPGQELTSEDVARITQTIEQRGALAVFVQPYASPENEMLRRAGEEAGVAVCTLYSDSLDDKVTSYIELIRFDADELHRCLGGQSGG